MQRYESSKGLRGVSGGAYAKAFENRQPEGDESVLL